MKNKLTRIVAGIVIPTLVTLSGCMTDGVTKITALKIERDSRISIGTPKEYVPIVSEKVYGESQIYERNTLTQETMNEIVNNPIYEYYQNRK